MCRGEKQNLQEKGLVQRSTDPIDGLWFSQRIVNSVRRSQDTVENSHICGLENKECLKPGIDHVHETPSTDRRLGSWLDALEISRSVKPRMWTMVCRSIYGPFCTSVVSICNQYCWSYDPRKGSTDRRSAYGPVSPTKADNQLTWDRAVMAATLVVGLEIDFARMLLAEIHDKAFKTSTTYPFPCLIFQLCRDSGVPIWHCDRLIHPTGTLDVGLIQDEVNVAAPRRGPRIDVPLGTDLVDIVKQMQDDEPTPPAHTNNAPASSSQATSQVPQLI
uniref:Integrase core domain containing protein n=1 Tax=Solanum tuberosum TaxID=4113 RepID=M1DE39_SOLTU